MEGKFIGRSGVKECLRPKVAKFIGAICVMVSMLSPASATQRVLSIPMKKLPETFDPQQIVSINAMVVVGQLHRGLMRFTPDLRVEFDAASALDIDSTGLIYTFKLANRSFADGTPLTSQHVKLSFERMLKKQIGLAGDFQYLAGIETPSPTEVRFRLKHKSSLFNVHLACVEAAILPLHSIDDVITAQTSGLGPYKIADLSKSSVKLAITESSRRSLPHAAESIQFVLLNEKSAVQQARIGKLDTLDGYSLVRSEVDELANEGMRPTVTSVTRQLFFVLNPKLLSKEERIYIQSKVALAPLSASLESMSSLIKAEGLIPPGLNGSLMHADHKQTPLLKLSKKRVLRLPLVVSDLVSNEVGTWIKEILSDRFDVELIPIDIETYMKKIGQTDWDLFLRSKFLDYPDGLSVLTYFKSGTRPNTFFVSSKNIDQLIDVATAELDRAKRADLYMEIQKRILAEGTIAPVLFGTDNQGLWNLQKLEVPSHPLGLQGLPLETVKFK